MIAILILVYQGKRTFIFSVIYLGNLSACGSIGFINRPVVATATEWSAMCSDNPLPFAFDNEFLTSALRLEDPDRHLPYVTGKPPAEMTILVLMDKFGRLANGYYLVPLDDPTPFDNGVEVVNLTSYTQEFRSYGGELIASFPPCGRSSVKAENLPAPSDDNLYIVRENVLKAVMLQGTRTIDDLALPRGDGGSSYSAYVHRDRYLVSARLLRLAPYEGSSFAARHELMREASEMMLEALAETRPLCGMRGLYGRPDPFDLDDPAFRPFFDHIDWDDFC